MSKRILMVVTNHTTITDDHKTGLWLEEFAVPYKPGMSGHSKSTATLFCWWMHRQYGTNNGEYGG